MEIVEYQKTEAALALLRDKYSKCIFNVTTTAGMNDAKEARREIRTYRTDLEKKRVEIKAPALERCKLIDTEAKRITVELVALEDPIDEQIKSEETRKENERQAKLQAEKARVDAILSKLTEIRNFPSILIGQTSAGIKAELERFDKIDTTKDTFQDFHNEALISHSGARSTIVDMLSQTIMDEMEKDRLEEERREEEKKIAAERAELAKLRAENEKREAEAQALRDAEDRRLKAEREEQEAKARKQQEEFDRIQKEQQAKEAEMDRQKAELDRRLAEQERQEQDAKDREEALKTARRADHATALTDIIAVCVDPSYTDFAARQAIVMIAEASL